MTRGSRQEGFTLLELLVAMTLLALLSLVLFGGLKFGHQVWQTATENMIGLNGVRVFQDEMRGDILRAVPVFIPDPLDPHIDFDGGPSQVMLLAPAHDGRGGLDRLVIASGAHSVTIAARRELATEAAASYVKTLRGVGHLRFAYFGQPSGEKEAGWHREWRDQTRLPLLIRINASADRGTTWPALMVSPHVAADQSCVYDPTAGFCDGR